MSTLLLLILVPPSLFCLKVDHVLATESCMSLWILAYRCLDHGEDLGSNCGIGVSQTGFLPVMLLQSLTSQNILFYKHCSVLFSQFFPPWVISLNVEKVKCQKWGKEILDAYALTSSSNPW